MTGEVPILRLNEQRMSLWKKRKKSAACNPSPSHLLCAATRNARAGRCSGKKRVPRGRTSDPDPHSGAHYPRPSARASGGTSCANAASDITDPAHHASRLPSPTLCQRHLELLTVRADIDSPCRAPRPRTRVRVSARCGVSGLCRRRDCFVHFGIVLVPLGCEPRCSHLLRSRERFRKRVAHHCGGCRLDKRD